LDNFIFITKADNLFHRSSLTFEEESQEASEDLKKSSEEF